MPKPASVTEFGTLVANITAESTAASHARFLDVKTYTTGGMPTVRIGQVYEDLDPRCTGRRIQVLKVGGDGKVLVRTVTPRTCPPRTPAHTAKHTTGTVSWIALRRFRENTRGFRLLRGTPLRTIQSYVLAARLAAACGSTVTEIETRTADALIGLLGNGLAHEYMDSVTQDPEILTELWVEGGFADLLQDAAVFAYETEAVTDWATTEVATASTARLVAAQA